jgi:hypothetical protein
MQPTYQSKGMQNLMQSQGMQNLLERIAGDSLPCTPPLPQPTTPPGAHYKAGFQAGLQAGFALVLHAGRLEAEGDALAVPSTPSDLSPPTSQPATPVWSAPQAIFIDAEGATHVSSEGVDVR